MEENLDEREKWLDKHTNIIYVVFTVLEVRFDDCVEHAIRLMYENNVFGAPIVDPGPGDALSARNPMDKDIGLIEFSSLVLWSLMVI